MAEISNAVLAALVILLVAISAIGTYVLLVLPGLTPMPAVAHTTGTVSLYVMPQPYTSSGTVNLVVLPK